MTNETPQSILDRGVTLPEHVAMREFAEQTVLLNLQSGNYHGLNAVAARMLEAAQAARTPREAIAGLASDYDQPESVIERDLTALLDGLTERGLVVADPDDAS